jgi:hypothetical protein
MTPTHPEGRRSLLGEITCFGWAAFFVWLVAEITGVVR